MESAEPMPFIMDDILVDFDNARWHDYKRRKRQEVT